MSSILKANLKGIMGCRLVKLLQATVILTFSFLKAQSILLQCFSVEFYEEYSWKSETCLHFCFKFYECLKDAASEIIQCEWAQKWGLIKIESKIILGSDLIVWVFFFHLGKTASIYLIQ